MVGELIQNNLFLILLLGGMVFIAIQAARLYATALPESGGYWLAGDIALDRLTGRRRYSVGFFCYLVPVALVYLIASFSPELLQLSMGIAGTSASVGAMTLSQPEIHNMSPVLAATAVAALIRVPPFSALERSLRAMAHGIAGVPRYIQHVTAQIRHLDVRETSDESPSNTIGRRLASGRPGLDSDLKAIHCFHDWIYGSTGTRLWADRARIILETAQPDLLTEFNALKHKQRILSSDVSAGEGTIDNLDERLDALSLQVREVRLSYSRLLAVLVVNQDELPEKGVPRDLRILLKNAAAHQDGSHFSGYLMASTLKGSVIALAYAWLLYMALISATRLQFENVSSIDAVGMPLIMGQSLSAFYRSSAHAAFLAAAWDVTLTSLVFLAGSAAGLAFRHGRSRSGDWIGWERHPIVQYAVVSLLAVICAALACEALLFIKLVVVPAAQMQTVGHFASHMKDFGASFIEYGYFSLLAAPAAILVCRLSDVCRSVSVHQWTSDEYAVRLIGKLALAGSMGAHLLAQLLIGDSSQLMGAVLATLVPALTATTISIAYWQVCCGHPVPVFRASFTALHKAIARAMSLSRESATREPSTTVSGSTQNSNTMKTP